MFSALRQRSWASTAATSLLVASACAVSAASASPGRLTSDDRLAGVQWRFDAGSTLPAAPAIGADGTVYVGTADGALQAIAPDGTLRWAYTLEGTALWAPLVDPSARIYVATAAQRLYSFSAAGALGWRVRTPVPVATDLVISRWGLLFGGRDGSLWAYSPHGPALWHVKVGAPFAVAPGVNEGRIVVGTVAGDVVFFDGATRRGSARLGEPARGAPLVLPDGSAALIAGTTLYRLDAGGIRFRREGVESVSLGNGELLAIDADGALLRLGDDGTERSRTALPLRSSVPPVPGKGGAVYVSGDSGALAVVRADGAVRIIKVARASLHGPLVDALRGRLVVAAGNGAISSWLIPE